MVLHGDDYEAVYTDNTNVGEARAVISGIGNFKNTVNLLFNIVSNEATPTKTNITTCSITNPADATYTGSILNPKPRIEDGTKVLEEGVDYTATYTDNVNVGTAHVRLSGIGDYIGEANVTFKVNAQPITYNKVKDIKTQRYTGSEIKPTVVIYSDSIILKEGTDYTVRYENNINPGTANIVITGKGNYSGTMNKTFIIEENNSGTTTITTNTSLEERDITIANKDIPQTGIVGFVKYIVITGLVGLFFYIKYKKEEIK